MTNRLEKIFWTGFTAWHGRKERSLPYAPLERLRRVQNRRIRSIVAFAYETVPFYREFMKNQELLPADFRTALDVEKLPLINSAELSKNPERFRSSAVDESRTLTMNTSGSTGEYKLIQHDIRALFLARVAGHRSRMVLSHFTGRSLGYKEVKVTRKGGTGPLVLQFYRDHSWVPGGIKLKRAMAYPEDNFESNIQVVNAHEPDVITGFGSYIGAMYRWAWLHGMPIYAPKVICHGGDTMLGRDQEIIESGYGIPVISRYQACEALNIAFQCEMGAGFHVSMDQVALRIVDLDGNTLPPGHAGEIVISNLINRGTVLLNYKLGDLASLGTGTCSCGRTLPTLMQLLGRTDDLIIRADGEAIHESVILSSLYAVPNVMQVQVTQESPARFLIKVVFSPGADTKAVESELAEHFLKCVGETNGASLRIQPVDSIPQEKNGKFRGVISHCSK